MGYYRAGFEITGVDRQNYAGRYPGEFIRADALEFLEAHGEEFDVIHASPPCQFYSSSTSRNQGRQDSTAELFEVERHEDLVPATRELLNATGRPWVIENVPAARLNRPLMLCGSMFGLGAFCRDGWRELRRHREFESPWSLVPPRPCDHSGRVVSVYGHGGGLSYAKGYAALLDEALVALGTPWMTRVGVSQAIPPIYTEWIGAQLRYWLARAEEAQAVAVSDKDREFIREKFGDPDPDQLELLGDEALGVVRDRGLPQPARRREPVRKARAHE
jgi:DNA (cytosine-5)-methyltransferase 1